jgi:excisionase family DNA binding protein
MTLDYKELIPSKVLFNLKTIDELGIAKISMMKKLIANGEISIVKIGNKIHVKRTELIRFLEANTVGTL